MSAEGSARRRAGVAMWAGIAGAALLLVVLLAKGWGPSAWGTAAGVLLLVCIAVCVWAAVTGEQSAREVRDATARLAELRRQAARPATGRAAFDDTPVSPKRRSA